MYLIQLIASLPYEPSLEKQDRVKRVVNARGFKLVQSSTPRNVVAIGTAPDESEGCTVGELLVAGLAEVLDCEIKGNVHTTAMGERSQHFFKVSRHDKLPVRKPPVFTISFSASWHAERGAKGTYVVMRDLDGREECDVVAKRKDFALPSAGSVNEAQYDTLDLALQDLILWCSQHGVDAAKCVLSVVSPAELVIKQVRGSWKVSAGTLIDRCSRVVKMFSMFDRRSALMTPGEVRAA